MKKLLISILAMSVLCGYATNSVIQVDLKKSKKVTPVEYGFHYEEIGMIGEGGLHAELVRNRGFEEATPPKGHAVKNGLYDAVNPTGNNKKVFHVDPMIGWITTPLAYSAISIDRTLRNPLNEQNPYSMQVNVTDEILNTADNYAIHNTGFYGMNFKTGNTYRLSFYAKANFYDGELKFQLSDENGRSVSAPATFEITDKEWKKYSVVLTANQNVKRGMLTIIPTKPGNFQLDMVSMFPSDTWDNGKSIFRSDIMQNLKDYSPDFIRFPGGCIVHGTNEETMYHWKQTIGDIAQRPGAWSKWAPYYRTDGLGYHEFYQLCEYLGSDAMYVAPTGMICTEWVEQKGHRNFQHIETDINYYINDALDAIEYAIGGADTKWGAERVKNGHPEPFPLKYVEIGNEDFGPVYYEKYDKMYRAIKAKYPGLVLIANAIIFGDEQDKQKYIADFKSKETLEVYDEHYYQDINWAIDNHYKFDTYERQGIDLFIGELGIGGKYPTNILAEGVVKLGLERNGDLNPLMADRPLMRNWDFLRHSKRMQPVLLHDASSSVKTFNYYTCKMLRDNKIDTYYTTGTGKDKTLFATAGKDSNTNEVIVKIINLSDDDKDVQLKISGLKGKKKTKVTMLTATEDQIVTPDDPDAVKPVVKTEELSFPSKLKVKGNSFTVFRITE